MKISGSEVILIVVLVLIGFVLYTQTGGTMKTTSIKKVGGKHVQEKYSSEHDYFQANKNWKQEYKCFNTTDCQNVEAKYGINPYTLSCGLWMSKTEADKFTSNYDWNIPIKIYDGDTSSVQVLDGICRKQGSTDY